MIERRDRSADGDPDMTPMLDVVFILLIFFVVTANFVQEMGLDVERNDHRPPPLQKLQPSLTLELLPGYRIRHEGRLIDVWAANALMKQFHVEYAPSPIAITLEAGAKHGTLVRLLDLAYQSGIPTGRVVVQQ